MSCRSQSLADLARQERLKRDSASYGRRIYTNEDPPAPTQAAQSPVYASTEDESRTEATGVKSAPGNETSSLDACFEAASSTPMISVGGRPFVRLNIRASDAAPVHIGLFLLDTGAGSDGC